MELDNNEITRRASGISTDAMLEQLYSRGNASPVGTDIDVHDLIREFNTPYTGPTGKLNITGFMKFLLLADRNAKSYGEDYGGVIAITDRQYIVANNANQCRGAHNPVFGKIFTMIDPKTRDELQERGYFRKASALNVVSSRLFMSQITARIVADGKTKPFIGFTYSDKPITQGQYESLEKFFSDYGEDIAVAQNIYGLEIRVGSGVVTIPELLEYYRLRIDANKEPAIAEDVEQIIGVPTKTNEPNIRKF